MKSRPMSQLFLLTLTGLMCLLYVFTFGDSGQETVLTVATVALLGLSFGLERFFPYHDEWNEGHGDTVGDIGSFIAVFGIIDGALKWLSPFIILAFLPEMNNAIALPLWVQVILAAMIIEFGAWVSHWAHHRYRPLWALHAMHHSTERLYTFNNFRFHPLNHVINYLVMFLPALALGLSPDAILGYVALTLPVLIFQHSNVGFDFGRLSLIFNTNTLHRWHHSAVYKEGMHNFGRAFVIWDHVFGTYLNPTDVQEPVKIGLGQSSKTYPKANQTIRQLLWPFSKGCCQ